MQETKIRSGVFTVTIGGVTFGAVAYDTRAAKRATKILLERGEHPWTLLQEAWNVGGGIGAVSNGDGELVRGKREGIKAFGRRLAELEQEKIKASRTMNGLLWWGVGAIGLPQPSARKFPPLTGDSLRKMSEAKMGSRNPRSKPVRVSYPCSRVEEFGAAAEAARSLGISPPHLCLWLSGRMVPKEFRGSGVKVERVG
jgi:hypothetical protein